MAELSEKEKQIDVITKWINNGWRITEILTSIEEDGVDDGYVTYKPGDKILIELTMDSGGI